MIAETIAPETTETMPHAPAPPPAMILMQMMDGIKVTQLIHAAAKLGIADLLKDGPKSSTEMAAAVGVQPAALYRVLRALAGLGIFRESEEGYFHLTPLAEPLRSDVPGSLRSWGIVGGEDWHLRMWGGLLYSLKTGLGAFPYVHDGMGAFEYFQHHPEKGAVFYEAMTNLTAQVSAAVLAAYDFSGFRRIVDVGCGNGTFSTAILNATPHLQSTLFDIPPVIEHARGGVQAEGPRGPLRLRRRRLLRSRGARRRRLRSEEHHPRLERRESHHHPEELPAGHGGKRQGPGGRRWWSSRATIRLRRRCSTSP